MKASQVIYDESLLTGFLWFFWLLLQAIFTSLLLLYFVHHSLQNQHEIPLKEMIALAVSILAAYIYIYTV